jgi:hypothetical protein
MSRNVPRPTARSSSPPAPIFARPRETGELQISLAAVRWLAGILRHDTVTQRIGGSPVEADLLRHQTGPLSRSGRTCLPEIARFGQIHRSRNDNYDRSRPGNRVPNLPLDFPPASHSRPAAACRPAPVTATLRVCLRGVPASSARKKWKAEKRISHKISQWVRAQG